MNQSIHFSDFTISRGRIDFRCVHTGDGQIIESNDVYFELSEPIIPSFDAIALACACMCGSAFRIIRIDIPVSSLLKDTMISCKNVVGNRPNIFLIDEVEATDIDNPIDFEFAEFVAMKEKSRR